MALLFLMVGLCSGLVGLAVGRVPSGVSLESPRAPALKSAVPQRNQTAVTTSTPTPTIAKKTDQIVPPASPPVVLLNPNSEKQATGGGAEGARPPLHPVGPGSPALATTVEKENDQDVPPANGTAGIGPVPRERTRAHRAHAATEPPQSKKPRAFRPERPATLADYGALPDYMMGQ